MIIGRRSKGKTTLAKELYKIIEPNVFIDYIPSNDIPGFNNKNNGIIITAPCAISINKEYRDKFDYIFIFKTVDIDERNRLYKYYGQIFPSFSDFEEAMNKHCNDYNCLVISTKENGIFSYKARM